MREIKFRLWNKNTKIMSSSFDIEDYLDAHDSEYGDGSLPSIVRDNLELMQYTGLHDKNGKEIYESDLVRFSCQGDVQNLPIIADMFNLRIGLEDKDNYLRFDVGIFEVLGNVYENPELLNKNGQRVDIGTPNVN